jgi:subtilisin family serine protease
MRARSLGIVLMTVVSMGVVTAPAGAGPVAFARPGSGAGRYIVVLKTGAGNPAAVAARQAASHAGTVGVVYSHALKGYSVVMPQSRVGELRTEPGVAYVVPDIKGSPLAGKPGGTPPPQQTPTGVDRIDGPTKLTQTRPNGVNADVAILDTGVDASHPDLNVVGGYWCGQQSATGYGNDANGHGTHVAGTVAARNNSIGVVGVAPGARIWSVRIPDRRGTWYMSAAICAVDWVAAQKDADGSAKIEAANMSWRYDSTFADFPGPDDHNCGHTNNDPLHTAICNATGAGTTFIAAAGNESKDAAGAVPAGFDEVITVSALADFNGAPGGGAASTCRADVDDTFADFSNFGPDVDLIAPGVCINSTAPGGGYAIMSGTSMAAPHVTGAAALYMAAHPTDTPAQVQAALVALGTQDWDGAGDPDGIKEPLLDVSTL